jgi:hypothetical protein
MSWGGSLVATSCDRIAGCWLDEDDDEDELAALDLGADVAAV